jgi:hypothetical protein
VSTRDRDFADLWVTSRLHRLDAAKLRGHLLTPSCETKMAPCRTGTQNRCAGSHART